MSIPDDMEKRDKAVLGVISVFLSFAQHAYETCLAGKTLLYFSSSCPILSSIDRGGAWHAKQALGAENDFKIAGGG